MKSFQGEWGKFASEKLDGICVRCKEGKILTALGYNVYDAVKSSLPRLRLPPDWFIAELVAICPETNLHLGAEAVKTSIKYAKWLTIWPHSTMALPCGAHLQEVENYFRDWGLQTPRWFELSGDESEDELLIQAERTGLEGWVISDGNRYHQQKLKVNKTLEAFASGFVDGKGQHVGEVGSITCSVYAADEKVIIIANVGSLSLEVRHCIDRKADLGRVLEVKYDRIGSKGKLRFPRFVRWRDDKLPRKCVVGQDAALARFWG